MTRSILILLLTLASAHGYAFCHRSNSPFSTTLSQRTNRRNSSLSMIDDNIIQGAAVGLFGLGAGLGLVAFTEAQGERARERGGGLSENMSTRIAGGLLEDVEVSSVSDIGSLTSQLEAALKQSGGAKDDDFKQSEEDIKRLKEEADDGW